MRDLDVRLRALEARLDELAGVDLCPECGSPSPWGAAILLMEDDRVPPRCPACDAQLDHQGRPLGPDPVVVVLEALGFADGEEPEPPGEGGASR